METIGLIAGNRKFPLIFAEAARKKGFRIVALAIKGDTSPRLRPLCDAIHWIGLDQFSASFQILKSEKITKVVMAGQISPRRLFSGEVARDPQLKSILDNLEDKRADTIFGAIAQRLRDAGFELLDSTTFLEDQMPQKGPLTRREPSFAEWDGIYFGLMMAKAIAYLDIGQTVAVKDKAVIAVEAFEGTDNLIRRSGSIGGKGTIIVKVSKPKQDMRFDIPVVGPQTVKTMAASKATCLAIEAGKTLFIDREDAVELADSKGIAIVAV